ncbi:MAG: hypothetical protein D3922_15500, partial [Candidatus Electrothrix sp. AR1]|nr:hypothetical protein [Candidatus Electrothrix sp. AR1]
AGYLDIARINLHGITEDRAVGSFIPGCGKDEQGGGDRGQQQGDDAAFFIGRDVSIGEFKVHRGY